MQNKGQDDVFNIAAGMIIKWYEETFSTMIIAVHQRRKSDIELMGILLAAKKQTLGALTLLANNHILPTHTMIRILSEIWVILAWILKPKQNAEKANPDDVYKKLRRWDHSRLSHDIKLHKKLPQTSEIKSALEKMEKDKARLVEAGIKELPRYIDLFPELGETPEEKEVCQELYATVYGKYSSAVHLNRDVTQNFIRFTNENSESASMLYDDDIKSDGKELFHIICICSDINKNIRSYYGWHIITIQSEYERLREMFIGDQK